MEYIMENASKALIMAAEIMLGIILISIFVLMYAAWSRFSSNINNNIQDTRINEFNSKFIIYDNRTDLTAHDVVTVASMANEYNLDKDIDSYKIKITGGVVGNKFMENIPEFLNNNSNQKFTLKIIKYNDKNKIVQTINITKTP